MIKRPLVFLIAAAFSFLTQAQDLKIWDIRPATTWMTESYPMGNGRFGGMVFGGIPKEHIQFNELSLWTGDEVNTGAYQAFGDLYIDLSQNDSSTSYRRELDISRAVQQITYTSNGTNYKREYFCSFPDQVMVLHFTADKKGAYSTTIHLKDAHGARTTAEGMSLDITGHLPNGLKYDARILLKKEGGTATAPSDSTLQIDNADGFTILLSAATDYSNRRSQDWKGQDPTGKIRRILTAAAARPYAELLSRHVYDYRSLFGRVSLQLGSAQAPDLPTFRRLLNYRETPDHSLEALLFQYGRYLLISSSRKGGLPANLQGLWNESNNPPWRSDYHSNINIQMNYWLAEPTNLPECHFPYLDYINSMREVKKESTKKEYPGVRGWTVKTENNIFGGSSFLWNTPGSAWYVQAIWEHYAFTKDKAWLGSFGYPILKEIVEFWDDHLRRRPDGTLVSPMGWSPEHGPTEDGVTYDQEIVYDLFTNYMGAADVLQIDKTYRDHVADMREHLLKPKIGKWGQLQEWETDRDDPKDNHRHASHLFALYPGRQISVTRTPELATAAKVSLQARGDVSTGWSMAWKMNFWARLQEGNHAWSILKNFITLVGGSGVDYNEGGGVYANLLCAHPPFQIDGNFGYTAGVAEMLVQSQADEIQLLPALPDEWRDGHVKGLRARGGFEITDMQWSNGKIVRLAIRSLSGGNCSLRVPNAITGAHASKGIATDHGWTYSLNTQPGGVYSFIGK
ncbi:glycoside hydrolase N-terminal domain-containing protein [Flavitalea sp. BT771]|uniref:glycoside hydrolase family 95 protein n=1 Tax=Flavitalea sp. BT771 TaxID=3063329 RepID=UPI0026E3C384|nr:glycoside hydrolase N-terminal domain-containing protein [Flavitalea sp. BT771]MDO6429289.1 glycoside hydrolase N-terminal domain-containing protein [Flavitalea sp. BT771]MDV6218583.1 glycoside hydrolase N-terminal domain-containing protein [Flavitalea sp. BT771]